MLWLVGIALAFACCYCMKYVLEWEEQRAAAIRERGRVALACLPELTADAQSFVWRDDIRPEKAVRMLAVLENLNETIAELNSRAKKGEGANDEMKLHIDFAYGLVTRIIQEHKPHRRKRDTVKRWLGWHRDSSLTTTKQSEPMDGINSSTRIAITAAAKSISAMLVECCFRMVAFVE